MVNWKLLLRDVAIVWAFTGLGGLVIGFTAGALGAGVGAEVLANPRVQIAVALSNLLFGIVAFSIVGALKKTNRFRHLFIVAVGAWLTSAVNMLFAPITLFQWLMAPFFFLVVTAIGGAISFLFVAAPKASSELGSN